MIFNYIVMDITTINIVFILVGIIGIGCLFFIVSNVDSSKRKEDKRNIYESTLQH